MSVFIRRINNSTSGNDRSKDSTNGCATYDNVEARSRMRWQGRRMAPAFNRANGIPKRTMIWIVMTAREHNHCSGTSTKFSELDLATAGRESGVPKVPPRST